MGLGGATIPQQYHPRSRTRSVQSDVYVIVNDVTPATGVGLPYAKKPPGESSSGVTEELNANITGAAADAGKYSMRMTLAPGLVTVPNAMTFEPEPVRTSLPPSSDWH